VKRPVQYHAVVTRDGRASVAEFPDCPGCHTQAAPGEDILLCAREALEGWLETHLVLGRVPPLPSSKARRAPAGQRSIMVPVSAPLAARLQLRAARHRAGLTQEALARKVGVSQQQIAGLESPDANITLGTLLRVADALGQDVAITLSPKGAAGSFARRG
jgi:DNA-binding XRE family transcriptional regulator/predicted RNase H-like HicB family nuclease